MEVILLERVAKLGQMGEVVRVRDGYARNFLLPKGKALRATADNKKRFESMKTQLEARNLELKGEAEKVGGKVLMLDRSLEDTLSYLFSLLGIAESTSPLQQMDPQIRQHS